MSDKNQPPARPPDAAHPNQDVMQMFRRGAEFTEELLHENERLRLLVGKLQESLPTETADAVLAELRAQLGRTERQRDDLEKRFSNIEAQNREFAARHAEIESENNNLMAIYVASYQLHSTLDVDDVLRTITEIMLNLVGAEVFVVADLDAASGTMTPLMAEGIDGALAARHPLAAPVLAPLLQGAPQPYVSSPMETTHVNPTHPNVCIPLTIHGRVTGAIVVYKFLAQKVRLAAIDHELFTLLGAHAASAIASAKLYRSSPDTVTPSNKPGDPARR